MLVTLADDGQQARNGTRRVILSAGILFLLALIPPSLSLFSFFRFDDFIGIEIMKANYPSFSLTHLLALLRSPFYEYYRPVAMIVWWVAYLVGGLDPRVYHLIASLFFGLVAVNLYLIGRFQSSDLAGWLSALAFITFSPTISVSWWISNFGVGFFGLTCFSLGVLLFLHLSDHPRAFTPLVILAFTCAFFAKASFVFLAPVPLLLYGTSPALRTRLRLVIAGLILVLSSTNLIIARILVQVPAVNSHVHLNLLELSPGLILRNLSDYWGLLLYGHSPFLVAFALIHRDIRIRHRRISRYWILPFLLIIVAVVVKRSLMMQGVGVFLLALSVWQAPSHTKVWGFWIVAGLAQVMFWDVPVLGGVMNRFILEPSAGFVLLLGSELATYVSDLRALMRHRFAQPATGQWRTRWLSRPTAAVACVGLFLIVGVYQEARYVYPTLKREWDTATTEGEIMRDLLQYIVPTLPARATLYGEQPIMIGLLHYSEFTAALFDFNRPDIQTVYVDQGRLPQTLFKSPPAEETVYALVGQPIAAAEVPGFALIKQKTSLHGQHRAYLYRLDRRP